MKRWEKKCILIHTFEKSHENKVLIDWWKDERKNAFWYTHLKKTKKVKEKKIQNFKIKT